MAATTLSEFVQEKIDESSLRVVEAKTGVARETLRQIAKKLGKGPPDIDTLEKLSAAYKVPMWRMIELAGKDLQLPNDVDAEIARITADVPELRSSLHDMLRLPPDRRRACVAYFAAMVRYESEQNRNGV